MSTDPKEYMHCVKKERSNLKIGVYIRSIGERTESLCIDSCRRYVDTKDIHVLKNYFPSYNVYREMLERALISGYDWFVAIDADVVLVPDWYDLVISKVISIDAKNTFKFTFRAYDPIYDELIDRGNHIYNNAFTDLALRALKKNIFISRMPWVLKRFFNPGYYLKPETSIRGMLKKKFGLDNFGFQEVIGIHGAEQYFGEIFRTFLVRSKRNPEWEERYHFLQSDMRERLLREGHYDHYVANLGWNYRGERVGMVDARQQGEFKKILEDNNIKERDPLLMSLESFYEKYRRRT